METQLENSFDIKKENNKFWLNRWDNDDFPWQQDEFNPKLLSFWNQLSLTEGSQVLVPLCGKSKDMLWLKSKGHKVLGVELSLKAIESFSEENNLKFNQSEQNNFQVFDSKNLSIFQGDIFKLSEKNLEKVEAVFDRGCYIALSEKNRKKLAEIYCNKLAKGSKILLLNLEYGGASAEPPPHSISESELEENFAKHFQISKHLDEDVLEAKEHYKDAGMEWARDKVHILIKK